MNRREAALKGWARRRLNAYLREYEKYIGKLPDTVTVWGEDFDRLSGQDDRVILKTGPEREGWSI